MKQLAGYILEYIRALNRPAFFFISLLTGFLIFLNYQYNIESSLLNLSGFPTRFAGFFIIYVLAFGGSYLVLFSIGNVQDSYYFNNNQNYAGPRLSIAFIALTTFAVSIFAWRMASKLITLPLTNSLVHPFNRYWAIILNPPLKCFIVLIAIYLVRFAGGYQKDLSGLRKQAVSMKPFLIILLCFVPVILISALQPDFKLSYPKAMKIGFAKAAFSQPWISALFFEISYAFDFVVAEVFFRGFLVLAFIRYAGPAAILPMANFYCAIHFGKPAVECISSYFGAILLGIVTLRTNSVLGGLLLHLGMGWMMELAGFLLR